MANNINKISKDIADVQMDFLKKHNFIPDAKFLFSLYTQGELIITDSQEDSLIQWFEVLGLM
jgi:hypothetical protein